MTGDSRPGEGDHSPGRTGSKATEEAGVFVDAIVSVSANFTLLRRFLAFTPVARFRRKCFDALNAGGSACRPLNGCA